VALLAHDAPRREIAAHVVEDGGPEEMLRRLSDPFWFQAFGCVLGFDWHSSGVTTAVTGALKEGLKGLEYDLGLFARGGKGATSRRRQATRRSTRCTARWRTQKSIGRKKWTR
jgi:hypothetical protein